MHCFLLSLASWGSWPRRFGDALWARYQILGMLHGVGIQSFEDAWWGWYRVLGMLGGLVPRVLGMLGGVGTQHA